MTGPVCFTIGVEEKGRPQSDAIGAKIDLPSGRYRLDVRESPAASLTLADGLLNGADVLTAPIAGRSGALGVVAEAKGSGPTYALTCSYVVGAPGVPALSQPVGAIFDGAARRIGTVAHQVDLA